MIAPNQLSNKGFLLLVILSLLAPGFSRCQSQEIH